MTVEEQFQQMRDNLNTLIRVHLDDDREYRERFSLIQAQLDTTARNSQEEAERIRALREQSEKHAEEMQQVRGTLIDTVNIQRDQAKHLRTHAKLLAERDERLERIGRHLEVLVEIVDGVIRKKS
jgi:hypothetical protein